MKSKNDKVQRMCFDFKNAMISYLRHIRVRIILFLLKKRRNRYITGTIISPWFKSTLLQNVSSIQHMTINNILKRAPESWQINIQHFCRIHNGRNVVFSSSIDVILKNKIVKYFFIILFFSFIFAIGFLIFNLYNEILSLKLEKNILLAKIQQQQDELNLTKIPIQAAVEAIAETPENSRIQGLVFFVGSIITFVIIRSLLGSTGHTSTPDVNNVMNTSSMQGLNMSNPEILPKNQDISTLDQVGQHLVQKTENTTAISFEDFSKLLNESIQQSNYVIIENANRLQFNLLRNIKKLINNTPMDVSVQKINTKIENVTHAAMKVLDAQAESVHKNQLEFEEALKKALLKLYETVKKIEYAVVSPQSDSEEENQQSIENQQEVDSQEEASSQWTTDSEDDVVDIVESDNNPIELTENISIPDVPVPNIPTIPDAGPQASIDWLLNNSFDVANHFELLQKILHVIIPPII